MDGSQDSEYTITIEYDEFITRFDLDEILTSIDRIIEVDLPRLCISLHSRGNSTNRQRDIATARELLHHPAPDVTADPSAVAARIGSIRPTFVCRHCGAPMIVIETFARAQHIRGPPCLPRSP
jgi:hypothetical protein